MAKNNICPDCRKVYSRMPKQCSCGCYLVKSSKTELDRSKCLYVTNGTQCKEIGTVSHSTKNSDWYCGEHAEKLRYENYRR